MRANNIEMRAAFCQKICQMTAMMETVVKKTKITLFFLFFLRTVYLTLAPIFWRKKIRNALRILPKISSNDGNDDN